MMTNPEYLEAYTEEMADEDDELLAGVTVDMPKVTMLLAQYEAALASTSDAWELV